MMKIVTECIAKMWEGLPVTLSLTILAILLAMFLGVFLSLGMKCRFGPGRGFFTVVSSFLKGIPILVFLYVFNTAMDGIMETLSAILGFVYDIRKPPTFTFAVLALALSYTPYMADMFITAMETVPKGQWEACEAGGFSRWQTLTRIIIPQCVVIALPNFGNHFVNLLKATSLACMVTIMEVMGCAKNYATMTQKLLECYTVCALFYWLVFVVFEQIFRILEKKTGSYLRPIAPRMAKKKKVRGVAL